jgi:hypothetical protein
VLAYVAIFAGAALIALATALAFAGVLRAIAVDSPRPGRPWARPSARPSARRMVRPRRPTATNRRPSPRPTRLDDYGLLRTVVLVERLDTGRTVRDLLTAAGVRATIASGSDGLTRVLVFPHEYEEARRMISWVL